MPTGLRARDAVAGAARTLRERGVPEPGASAEILLAELLGVKRGALLDAPLGEEQARVYGAWISRRAEREPVQRILGRAYFRNLTIELDGSALIPRPDTESVVDVVLDAVDRRGYPCRVLDMGTGSGAIAVSIAQERPRCEVDATDVSGEALATARRNAAAAGVAVRFHEADVFSGLDALAGAVDLLVSNPPYVESAAIPNLPPEVRDWDPHSALDGGPDGLRFYRRIFAEAPPLLADGADVVLEVGDGQAGAVLEAGERAGFASRGSRRDLTGTPRAVLLRWTRG